MKHIGLIIMMMFQILISLDLFDGKVLYDENLKELVKKGILFERLEDKNKYVKEFMEIVRDNHTYLNRIESILWFFDKRYEELSS